jgi:hypothetical protein
MPIGNISGRLSEVFDATSRLGFTIKGNRVLSSSGVDLGSTQPLNDYIIRGGNLAAILAHFNGEQMEQFDSSGRKVQTIQATAKRWKALQGVGVLLIVVGFTLTFIAFALKAFALLSVGGTLIALGVPFYIVGRVGGWWFHG